MAISSISSVSSLSAGYASTSAYANRPLTVQEGLRMLSRDPSSQFKIADGAQNIEKYWDKLNSAGNSVTSISLNGLSNQLKLSADQFSRSTTLMGKVQGVQGFQVQGTVSKLAALSSSTSIASMDIVDTASNIQNGLTAIAALGDKVTQVNFSGPPAQLKIDVADYLGRFAGVISKLPRKVQLQLENVQVAAVQTLLQDPRITGLKVSDTVANVQSGVDMLQKYAKRIDGFQNTSSDNSISLTAKQFKGNTLILNKMYQGYELGLYGGTVQEVSSLKGNRLLEWVNVSDTAQNISKNIRSLAALGSRLDSISVKDPEQPLSLALQDIVLPNGTPAPSLAKIDSSFSVKLTEKTLTASQLVSAVSALTGSSRGILTGAKISDTASTIYAAKAALTSPPTLKAISSIEVADGAAYTADFSDVEFNGKFSKNTLFEFEGLNLDQFFHAQANYRTRPIGLFMTANDLQQRFSEVLANKNNIKRIDVAGAQGALSVPAATIRSNLDLIKKISAKVDVRASDQTPIIKDADFKTASVIGLGAGHWLGTGSVSMGRYGIYADAHVNVISVSQPIGAIQPGASDKKFLLSFGAGGQFLGGYSYGIKPLGMDVNEAISKGYAAASRSIPSNYYDFGGGEAVRLEINVPAAERGVEFEVFFADGSGDTDIFNVSLIEL